MKNKRFKLTIATISVAGFIGTKKVTNTVNWRVCCIDEKDIDGLIAAETQKLLTSIKDSFQSTTMEFRAKTTTESHYFDTFLSADVRKIGTSGESDRILKQL